MNRLKYIFGLILGLSLLGTKLQAQDLLQLEEAILLALENNHQIKIKRYNAQIQVKQVNPVLVGMRPEFKAVASYELGWSDANIETLSLAPGQEGNSELALDGISNDIIISPEISMLVLDGKARKYQLEQLGMLSQLADLEVKDAIQNTVAEVSRVYLQMAQQQLFMDITEQRIALNKERLNRVLNDANYGTSFSLQALQIEVDIKTDSATLRNQRLAFENDQRELNQLLAQDLDKAYQLQTTFNYNTALNLTTLEQALKQRNIAIQSSNKGIDIATASLKQSQSAYKPKLQAYANLSYAYLQNEANFLQSTRSIGPNVGLQFQYTIADWGARRIKEENAMLLIEQRKLEKTDLEEVLRQQLHNAFAAYQNSIEQLRIEESNLEVFEENLKNTVNRFKLGTATNTDVRDAQLNLSAAQSRITANRYQIKQAEINLYFLTGQLVQ